MGSKYVRHTTFEFHPPHSGRIVTQELTAMFPGEETGTQKLGENTEPNSTSLWFDPKQTEL